MVIDQYHTSRKCLSSLFSPIKNKTTKVVQSYQAISQAVQTVRCNCKADLLKPDKYFSKLLTGYIRL